MEVVNGRRLGRMPTESTVSLFPPKKKVVICPPDPWIIKNEPNTYKCDRDVDAKRLFEFGGLFPADIIGALVHFVGKRNLLKVPRRQQPDFVQHTSEAGGGKDL